MPATSAVGYCPHCNGYGSSLKEESDRCSRCGGSGVARCAVCGQRHAVAACPGEGPDQDVEVGR